MVLLSQLIRKVYFPLMLVFKYLLTTGALKCALSWIVGWETAPSAGSRGWSPATHIPKHTHVLSIFLLLVLNDYFYNYFDHYKSTAIPGATKSSCKEKTEKTDCLVAVSESCVFSMGSYWMWPPLRGDFPVNVEWEVKGFDLQARGPSWSAVFQWGKDLSGHKMATLCSKTGKKPNIHIDNTFSNLTHDSFVFNRI